MAISFDSSAQGAYPTPSTFNHTCGTGSATSGILFVAIEALSGSLPSAVTYNGVAMTLYGTFGSGAYAVWYLLAPPSGTHTVAITTTSTQYIAVSSSYLGVSQTGFPDSEAAGTGGNSAPPQSVSTTVVAANCWLVTFAWVFQLSGSNTPTTFTSSRTDRQYNASANGSATNGLLVSDSNGTVSTGSETTTFNATGSATPFIGAQPTAFSLAPGATNPSPSVSDTTPVTDVTNIVIVDTIPVSDTTAVTDLIQISIQIHVSVSDTTIITDPIRWGNAIVFNGSNQGVIVPNSPSLNITGAFSLSAWMNCTNFAGSLAEIISKEGGGAGYYMWTASGGSAVHFGFNAGAFEIAAGNLSPNTWYHVVGTYDPAGGTNNGKFYLNGSVIAVKTSALSPNSTSGALGLGSNGSGNSQVFTGTLDQMMVWNRVLTPTEISNLYSANNIPTNGLVGEWNFNEDSGTTAFDISGNGNNGTLHNSPTRVLSTIPANPNTGNINVGIQVAIADTTSVIDQEAILVTITINVSDTTAITDNVQIETINEIIQSDTVAVTDPIQIIIQKAVSIIDSIPVTDAISVTIGVSISVSDIIPVTDSIQIETIEQGIAISDMIAMTDATQISIQVHISVADTTVVSDSINIFVFKILNGGDFMVKLGFKFANYILQTEDDISFLLQRADLNKNINLQL